MPWWVVLFSAPFRFAPGLTWIVLYWLTAASGGLLFKVSNARASLRQWRRMPSKAEDDEGLRITALMDLVAEAIMGACVVFALGAGLFASVATTAQTPSVPGRALALSLVLELVVTALASHAFCKWLGRRLSLRRIRRSGAIRTSTPALIAIHPDTMTITGWTSMAQVLFGWDASEALGKTVAELLIPDARKAQHRESVRRWKELGELPGNGTRIAITAQTKSRGILPFDIAFKLEAIGNDETCLMAYCYSRRSLRETARAERAPKDTSADQ
jgi:PAS domain-containing protein